MMGLLNLIHDRHMEGHENPFGATRVHSLSSEWDPRRSSTSSTAPLPKTPAHIDDYYPRWPLFNPSLSSSWPAPYGLASQIIPPSDSSGSMKLASSEDLAMAAAV